MLTLSSSLLFWSLWYCTSSHQLPMAMWCSLCLYEIQVQYKTLVHCLHTCSGLLLRGELAWQHQPDQSFSVFVCLTFDLQWNRCYFGCTQCISSIYSKGKFSVRSCRFEKCPFRGWEVSFSLAYKFLISSQVLGGDAHIFTNSIVSVQKASESWIYRKIFYCSGKFYHRAMEK